MNVVLMFVVRLVTDLGSEAKQQRVAEMKTKNTYRWYIHIKSWVLLQLSFSLTCITGHLLWGGFNSWCSSCCHVDQVSWTWLQIRYITAGKVDCLWVNKCRVVVGLNQVLVILLNTQRFWPEHLEQSGRVGAGYNILYRVWYWTNNQRGEKLIHLKISTKNYEAQILYQGVFICSCRNLRV